MIRDWLKYLWMFLILVLIQVLILNNIQFSGYINPYMYILFILLLPFNIEGYLLLLLSFLMGFSIDIFSNTLGIHSAATVFAGFIRPTIIDLISSRDSQERGTDPRITQQGLGWFLKYSVIMILSHHFVLFFIEAASMGGFFHTLFRIILSSLFTIILVVTSQYLIFKK